MVIDLEAVLHGGRIDLRREPAGANEGRGILPGGPACGLDLLRRLARGLALAARDEDPGLAGEILQAFLQGAAGGRGQAAAMPIETEDAAEGLEPDRVGEAAEQARCAFLREDRQRHFAGQRGHALEQPAWRAAAMERQVGGSGAHRLKSSRP